MDEIFKTIQSLFDIRYMVTVFVTSQVLLRYTNLSKLKTNHKRFIVLIIGVVHAVVIAKIDFMISNIAQSASIIFSKYGVSLFSTVLFYDAIYKKVMERVKS